MSTTSHDNTAGSRFGTEQFQCFLEMVSERAKECADAPALVLDDRTMSYRELEEGATLLARRFSNAGLHPGSIAGICLDRGFDVVLAMLAVLKSGGVFLPIDPRYPQSRRQWMIEDAEPAIMVTSTLLVSAQRELFGTIPLVCIDDEGREAIHSDVPRYNPAANSPAYVIYTSGSTGKPKGALNTHAGLANLATQQIATFNIEKESRILQFASFSFDAAISEIVMALGAGAALVLARQEEVIPGPSLAALLARQRITHVTLPPSVLAALPSVELPELSTIIVAGESCPIELARRWAKGRTFFNAYGVSEAAVCASMRAFDPGLPGLPIGKAMGGVTFLVLNEDGRAVSAGDSGELFLGGVGVALGYLNRPELNREKFVTLEIPGTPSGRFYRTGDRVRQLLDGSLEFIGRTDNQVKIRGFRIEPDEIAAAIEEHEKVLQCAVVACSDKNAQQYLAAFIVLDQKSIDSSAPITAEANRRALSTELRSFLKERLPSHMIPNLFVPMTAFPLSPTGKIDLAVLRNSMSTGEHELLGEAEPETEMERRIFDLCRGLLRSASLSLEDSFLDAGGDSLQAAQLAWRLEEQYGVRVTEADILEAPSLRSLGELLASIKPQTGPKLVPVPRNGWAKPAPGQEIFGLLEKLNVDTSRLNCCAAFEIIGALDSALFAAAYRDLFERHEGLRLKFSIENEFLVAAHDHVDPPFEIVDLRSSSTRNEELQQLLRFGERIRFDLRNDVLIRSTLVRLKDGESLLIVIAHHAVFDAWSLHVFVQDLFALMAARTGGNAPGSLPVQYIDYLSWLHESLSDRNRDAEHTYLSKVFSKPRPPFDLKDANTRPNPKSGLGSNIFSKLPLAETNRLYEFCDSQRLTPFMVCTSALKVALYFNSDQPDITIGGPVSTRYHRDLERQIGLYGSNYAVRTNISDQMSVRALLLGMKARLLESYRHQVHSITDVLRDFDYELDLSRTAPYDISVASHMFDLNFCDATVANRLGIRVVPFRYPLTTSFFDLEITFHLFENEIDLEIRFDTAIYPQERVERLTADFRSVLELMLTKPELTIGAIREQM